MGKPHYEMWDDCDPGVISSFPPRNPNPKSGSDSEQLVSTSDGCEAAFHDMRCPMIEWTASSSGALHTPRR